MIEKSCDDWKRLWLKKLHACNKMNFSSNVNEVIKAVLNSLFFITKRFHMHPKAKKHKSQRQNRAKAQNTTSEQK